MKKVLVSILLASTLLFSENIHENEQVNRALKETFQIIWQEAMAAKSQAKIVLPNIREELLENLYLKMKIKNLIHLQTRYYISLQEMRIF